MYAQTLVDVLGVVIALGPLGSIKRKQTQQLGPGQSQMPNDGNQQEVTRRDVTLVDQCGKSVVLTLWGELAEQAGTAEGACIEDHQHRCILLQARSCRVTAYNGEGQRQVGSVNFTPFE
jgi:hypothetical protein